MKRLIRKAIIPAAGLGNAIWCAQSFIGDEPFAVLLGDDVVVNPEPCLRQMIRVFEHTDRSVIAVQRVPLNDVSRYGVVQPVDNTGALHVVGQLLEKPRPEQAPSNLAIIGRYILTPAYL